MIDTNTDILFKTHEFFFNVLYLLRNPSGKNKNVDELKYMIVTK